MVVWKTMVVLVFKMGHPLVPQLSCQWCWNLRLNL